MGKDTQMFQEVDKVKIQNVIQKLIAFHPEIDETFTCDTVKIGNPEIECTGIVVSVCATMEVLRQAAGLGANLIIVHEPLFYSHEDKTGWLVGNQVYETKRQFIEDHHLVVWRDHDRLHGGTPARSPRDHMDRVFEGIMKELGWEKWCKGYPEKPLLYEIPETTGEILAKELVSKLGLSGARFVGNRNARVRRVFFCEHVTAAARDGQEPDRDLIREVEDGDYNALIPFEIVDWTLSAYVKDAAQQGKDRVLIEMGHFNTEELAMRHMAKWLPKVLQEPVPVHFVQSSDFYSYLTV